MAAGEGEAKPIGGRVMELEIINKLFLELSQIATATTAKELELKKKMDAAEKDSRYWMNVSTLRGARMQLMWRFIQTVNRDTGIELPEIFFDWFDADGVPAPPQEESDPEPPKS